MNDMTAPATTFSAEVLGPYFVAAASLLGPSSSPDIGKVTELAVQLALAADSSGKTAEQERPIRQATITGILGIGSRNSGRTQVTCDTGTSQFGPDQMWTEFEEPEAAARTHAILLSLVGRKVKVTKATFYEYDGQGAIVMNAKNEPQTRTRLYGTMYLVGEDGSETPVDFAAATPAQAAPAAADTPVNADAGRDWLVQNLGEAQGLQAFSTLTVTNGTVGQHALRAAYDAAAAVPAAA